jgi:hypothetical protein
MKSKKKKPEVKSTKTLSADHLHVILDAISYTDGQLDKLHWSAVTFGATDPLYRNIASHRFKMEQAKSALCTLFEQQFEPIVK